MGTSKFMFPVPLFHLTFLVEFAACRAGTSNWGHQAQQPGPNMARLVKLAGNALRRTADRKGDAAKVGHRCEHRFIGDIVADENRKTARDAYAPRGLRDAR